MTAWLPVFVVALSDEQVPHANDNAEKTQNANAFTDNPSSTPQSVITHSRLRKTRSK